MYMLADFNQPIIHNYSPISARGGSKARRAHGRSRRNKLSRSRKLKTRRHNRSNTHSKNVRTRTR